MKLLITLLLISSWINGNGQTNKIRPLNIEVMPTSDTTHSPLRTYYFIWRFYHDGDRGIGENDFTIDHKLTRKELLTNWIYPLVEKEYRKYLTIDLVMEFKTKDEFYSYHHNSGQGQILWPGQSMGFSIPITTPVTTPTLTSIAYADEDSLTAERFFTDSLGNQYMVEYRYTDDTSQNKYPAIWKTMQDGTWEQENHKHWIAICSIITYRGNRRSTIASNIKAIYSPVECSSDNSKLWLKRLYQIQNKK